MTDTTELSIGSKALDFSLPANTGMEIALSNYLTRNNVYLFFVREFN